MLEKIGLPAKPSMRGGSWVVDASHCQGCSSQFTFINRKHHCRRCGGIFCNSCSQQRMVLRGQGDSPVRICEPCKKLEEAARFELRYGHRTRPAKGSSKVSSKHDDILNQILERNVKHPSFSSHQTSSDVVSFIEEASSSSANPDLQEESKTPDKIGDIVRSLSADVQNNLIQETGSSSPEELRRQAAEQKMKYKILKGEGKSEEALLAFKRGKELERQAGALEIALRKSRRRASIQKPNDNNVAVFDTKRASKVEKDDLASELRELGWSDADLRDSGKQKEKLSLEGELSSLLKETSEKSHLGREASGIDKTQVITHKKKALMLKREGKLAEAKEELKQAKILEKQLEEQELLAEAEDSDDELSSLIRNMDDDKQYDLSLDSLHSSGVNFGPITDLGDDSTFDVNFDVTDDDMNDPEIASALKSFGWSEDDGRLEDGLQSAPADSEMLEAEILSLKKEAIKQKQPGNIHDAKELLKRVHLLERDRILPIKPQQSDPADAPKIFMPHESEKVSSSTKVREQNTASIVDVASNHGQRSKLTVQKELLASKKKALALKREGRIEEAEEEMTKGKVLEQELEEMKNMPNLPNLGFARRNPFKSTIRLDESDETEVSEQDMKDPAILSLLENFGWNEETESATKTGSPSKILNNADHHKQWPRSKLVVQKELLSLKKKALSLRRDGRVEEAEEELRKGKVLEQELEEMERKSMPLEAGSGKKNTKDNLCQVNSVVLDQLDDGDETEATEIEMRDPAMLAILKNLGWKDDDDDEESAVSIEKTSTDAPQTVPSKPMSLSRSKVDIQRELLIIKRNALALRRQGKAEEADEKLRKAKDLESQLAELEAESPSLPAVTNTDGSELPLSDNSYRNTTNVISDYPDRNQTVSAEHGQLQGYNSLKDQVLAHKRKAVAFKREGKIVEAREELRHAKQLEKELEGDGRQANADGKTTSPSKILDATVKQESTQLSSTSQKPLSGRDRFKLQQESLAHKRKALKLRRDGKTEEAEAELELAKKLESQLEEMDRNSPSINKPSSNDDALVEDLLDPQLMSALKAIGWDDTEISRQEPPKPEAKASTSKNMIATMERAQLEEQIKAEKIRALNLKRSGKQNEALGALRSAKLLEKKLESLAS